MSDPFIGEIVMFGGSFAPRGWALCDGQLIGVSTNDALFSIIGTTYGGDGRTTFGLPDLRGRSAVHAGSGPGLPPINLGARGGVLHQNLSVQQLPSHNHALHGENKLADQTLPGGHMLGRAGMDTLYQTPGTPVAMAAESITATGAGHSFDVQDPYQAVNFIISLYGTYPSRN